MKSTQSAETSTGISSQTSFKGWRTGFLAWLGVWWPIVLLGIIFAAAGIFKYFLPQTKLFPVMIDLIKAISVLLVAIYVVYTRILSLETKKMAEASMGLYMSQKGTVLAELSEAVCNFKEMPPKAQEIARTVHLEDKKMTGAEFDTLITKNSLPSVNLKIKNMSGRRIEVGKIAYSVRHTGTTKHHSVLCETGNLGSVNPWEDRDVSLIVAPEGEIEVSLEFVDYIDGGIVQRVKMDKKILMERIRKPEKT